MRIEEVADASDARAGDYRGVRDPAWLRERGLFIAEGRQIISLLLQRADIQPRSVLLTPAALQALQPALTRTRDDLPVYLASPELLREIGGYRFHQGALAAAPFPPQKSLEDLLQAPAEGGRSLVLALDRVTNPDNVGSLFRNALAFGAAAALLHPRCAHPLYRKALRTSMGAALRVPFAVVDPWSSALERLKATGHVRVALTPRAESSIAEVVRELAGQRAVALLLGHESEGLAAETLGACDLRARIPMAPGVDSINVAAASGIALYALSGL